MLNWLHHLFNPHCPDCELKNLDKRVCNSCETLKMQLDLANIEKKQLLETILSFTKPTAEESRTPIDYEAIKPKMMSWNVRRQMLEAEDRKQAQIIAETAKRAKEIEELEKEVGLEKEVTNA